MNSTIEVAGSIKYEIIKCEEHDEILKFMRKYYYLEEPLTIGIEPIDQHDIEDEEFNVSNIKYGTCLKMMENDCLIGVILAGPKTSNASDEMLEQAELYKGKKWGYILQILENVERSSNVFQRFHNVNEVLHAHVLCIHPDKRRRNLATHLMMALIQLAQSLKFDLITTDCTSEYSARLCENLGKHVVDAQRWSESYVRIHDANSDAIHICGPIARYNLRNFSSRVLYNKDDIEVRIIPVDFGDRLVEFLRLHYYKEEPLTVGLEPKDYHDKEDEEYIVALLKHKSSLLALQKTKDRWVGVVTAGPKGPNEAQQLFQIARTVGPTKFGQTVQIIACIERDTNIFGRYNVSKVLHVHTLSTHKEMRGKNLGAILLKELVKLAKEQKYELITVDCSSYYSARLCERLGWENVNTLYYKDYRDENDVQIFRPNMPHESIKTFAYKLTDNIRKK